MAKCELVSLSSVSLSPLFGGFSVVHVKLKSGPFLASGSKGSFPPLLVGSLF